MALLVEAMKGVCLMDEKVKVGEQDFKVDDIYSVQTVTKAFRKALEAQEYRIGNRSVRRADIDKLWAILKSAEDEQHKKNWDKHATKNSRQVLFMD